MAKTAGSGRHHISPTIRGAFLRALDLIEREEGKTFSELLKDEIKENGLLSVMDRVAKFTERTSEVNMNHTGEVSLVSILSSLAEGAGRDTEVEEQPGTVRH